MTRNIFKICLIAALVAFAGTAIAAGPGDIKWDNPKMTDRITAQGPVEVIPADYDDYGVKLSGKKGMLKGYVLPEGWKKAVGDVKKLVATNSGGLKHDPATVLNAKIFEKMTGIHIDLIEMKDPLLWPKSLSVAMAGSDDVDLFYSTRSMLEIPHLAAAGWILSTDPLWTPEVNKLYAEKLLNTIKAGDGRFYGSPFCLWAMHLFYRKSWLKGAGVEVPKTWQELVVATKKVGDWAKANVGKDCVGMVHAGGDKDQLHQILSMVTFSQDKRIMVDGKVKIDPAAWDVLTGLWTRGGMSKESTEYMWSSAPEVFAKGKAGFIITGGVYMKNFANPKFGTGIKDDWGVTMIPAWEGVGKPGIAVAGNDGWMINKAISPEKQAAALLWNDYQRSYQAQFNELYLEGNESVMLSVYDHPAVMKDVSRTDLRKATVAAMIGENYPPGMMDVLEILMEYLHKVALGMAPADESLKKAQEEIDSIQ
jgi:ABC-type glycerol-3-phosphate transport system substrate-binding protein